LLIGGREDTIIEEAIMAQPITLEEYRNAHTEMRRREEKRGFRIHLIVYSCVIPVLAAVNLVFVPQFLWFFFPLLGWGFGLTMHYVFGYRRLEKNLQHEDEGIAKYAAKTEGGLS
jgi:hypothetical protein